MPKLVIQYNRKVTFKSHIVKLMNTLHQIPYAENRTPRFLAYPAPQSFPRSNDSFVSDVSGIWNDVMVTPLVLEYSNGVDPGNTGGVWGTI